MNGPVDDAQGRGPDPGGGRASVRPGKRIGRYVLLDEIGRGGMGVVYLAHDPDLDRQVALKVLRPERDDSVRAREHRARLLREAQAMARLSHPNVITVYDAGTVDARQLGRALASDLLEDAPGAQRLRTTAPALVFIAMDYVPGRTLRHWLATRRRSWREIVTTMLAAGRGLAAAHQHGIVHRDFKPDNVLVGDDGRVCVLDFGLARAVASVDTELARELRRAVPDRQGAFAGSLTRTGRAMGTPPYMSVEQHMGWPIDGRSDQYAFCVALFEALWRRRPFLGRDVSALAREKARGLNPLPRCDRALPSWLSRAIARGLRPDAARRFASMDDLLAVLERGLAPVHTGPSIAAAVALGTAALAAAAVILGGAAPWGEHASVSVVGTVTVSPEQAAVSAHRDRLADVRALEAAGRYGAAEMLAASVLESAEQLDEHPVRAEARLALARVLLGAGDFQAAGEHAMAAHHLATSLRTDEAAAAAAILLVGVHMRQGRYDRAREWEQHARAALDRAGRTPELEADLRLGQAAVREREGDYAGAVQLAEAALALRLELSAEGRGDEGLVRAHQSVAHALRSAGRLDLAKVHYERALELGRAVYGPAHPVLAPVLDEYGALFGTRGENEAARALHQQALEIRVAALGEHHPDVAMSLNNLAIAEIDLRRLDDAQRHLERAIAIKERHFATDHPDLAVNISNLGRVHEAKGELEAAERMFERAIEIQIAVFGAEHPRVGLGLTNLGVVALRRGDDEAAIELSRRALRVLRVALGTDDVRCAYALTTLGKALHEQGQTGAAVAELESALELRDRPGTDPVLLAETRIALARALAVRSRSSRRPRELALAAHEALRGRDAADRADAEALLHELGLPVSPDTPDLTGSPGTVVRGRSAR